MGILCVWMTVKGFWDCFHPESSGHNLDLNSKIMD